MAGRSVDMTNIKIQNSFGFTLLEILISIFIFAIVVTTVFGSYNFVLSSSETVDKTISSYEMGQNCLNRMIVDLESIYVCLLPAYSPPDFDDFPDTYRITGDISDIDGADFSRLRFTSLAHVPIKYKPQGKISEIVYYDQEGAEYENWDSDLEQFGNETPVAISIKLEIGNDSDFQLFETMVAIPVHREKKSF
jgi:general secretion pathway protein J